MPTVLRWKGYRVFFYVSDRDEPPHVHVFKDGMEIKVWLDSCAIAVNKGCSAREAEARRKMVEDFRQELTEAWHGYFRSV
ncbi:MAG: DUF4160 domain-containing protein [Pseudomonadota bacterium]|nr:DUF4160 domain-containing protein [Pseudomonadota bacterium]